jgi:hypothetical protein
MMVRAAQTLVIFDIHQVWSVCIPGGEHNIKKLIFSTISQNLPSDCLPAQGGGRTLENPRG